MGPIKSTPLPYVISPDAGIINRINQATGTSTAQGGLRAPAYTSPPTTPNVQTDNYNYEKERLALLREQNALAQRQLEAQIAATPRLLPFDYLGTQAKARQQAEGAVNPLYTKKFQDYLAQAKINQQRQVEDTNQAVTTLDENLKNLQESNAIAGARTTEDTQNNIDQLNTAQTNFQGDTGLDFERARMALARSGDNSGSGLDAQRTNELAATQNTNEQRQVANFNEQKNAQDRFKVRTLADLNRSNELAGKSSEQNKATLRKDLARYIQDYGADEGSYGYYTKQQQQDIESQRLAALVSEQARQYSNLFNQFLASNKGARAQDLQATRSLYGV